MSTEIPVKLRSKKTPSAESAGEYLKNPYVVAGAIAVIVVAIYIYYKKNGPFGGGGGESADISPIGSGPARTSMDMAVIPGARTG